MGLLKKKGIFCEDCRYYQKWNSDIVDDECSNQKMWYGRTESPTFDFLEKKCSVINENNDCLGFEKKSR